MLMRACIIVIRIKRAEVQHHVLIQNERLRFGEVGGVPFDRLLPLCERVKSVLKIK